ncbi:hypothetical protein [Rohdeia mirabilis]|uniref:hypothetical protein n=1 Tax=Rohdeia mirabilis TaxID=2528008 RepID=UPI003AF3BB70
MALDPGRRLEDRVLDLVRAVDAARAGGGAAVCGATQLEGEDDVARIGRQVLALRPRR